MGASVVKKDRKRRQTTGRFLQAFLSPSMREKQLRLHFLHSSVYVLEESPLQTCPFGKHLPPVSVHLLGFTFRISTKYFSFILSFLCHADAAQLYQQYNEAAQNFEILRQIISDVPFASEDTTPSPAPSPLPARRPLPPLPPAQPPRSLSYAGSVTSVQSLPLPEPPKMEGRPSSPRLSISLTTKSSTLWRELPGVRNSHELEELTEDQRRLQEVTQIK